MQKISNLLPGMVKLVVVVAAGIWICPEGAAALAAIELAIERGLINSGDKVVAFNTGSFEKYLPHVRDIIFS